MVTVEGPRGAIAMTMQIFKKYLRGPWDWVSPDRGISNRYPNVVDGNELVFLLFLV